MPSGKYIRPRVRQTRLTFEPAISSSPTAPDSSFTPAFVGYEGSPPKRRKLNDNLEGDVQPLGGEDSAAPKFTLLPTPVKSSQLINSRSKAQRQASAESDDSDSEPVIARANKQRYPTSRWTTRSSQGMLKFDRDPGSSGDNIRSSHLSHVATPRHPFTRHQPSAIKLLSSDDNSAQHRADADQAKQDSAHSSAKLGTKKSLPSRRTTTGRRSRVTIIESSDDKANQGFEVTPDPTNTASPTKSGSSEDEAWAPSVETMSSAKRKRSARAEPSFVVSSDEEHDSEVVRTIKVGQARKKSRGHDGVGGKQQPPAKVSKARSRQEKHDLDEDLDFLRSSPPALGPSSAKKKSNARQEALEALKRRRNGNTTESSRRGPLRVESDSEPARSSGSEAEEAQDEVYREIGGSQGIYLNSDEEDDPDLDNFIVEGEDEDERIGAPEVAIPIHLTSYARMKARDLFRYVVEWMVQKKLNPAFNKDDELYQLAFNKLDDELKGLVGSKFTSSAWTPDFIAALQGRPGMDTVSIQGGFLLDHCEACNRKQHPATYQIRFYGKPYHPDTLEEIEHSNVSGEENDTSDEESSDTENRDDNDEDDAKAVYDHKGRLLPKLSRAFSVGQFCMRNATTAHSLHHWRIHLYGFIVDHLKLLGTLTAERIVERDSWSVRKRNDYANKIVDQMIESGEVRALWRDFRGEIDEARNATQAGGRYNGRLRV